MPVLCLALLLAPPTDAPTTDAVVAPHPDERSIPKPFRLPEVAEFAVTLKPVLRTADFTRFHVTMPSPVTTAWENNNTVHADYFRPHGDGPYACVIVMHIAGGDFALARGMCGVAAANGIAALFVRMPHYGERRDAAGEVKMLSEDLDRGLESMRQSVLDLRRCCDWLQRRPELDGRLGVWGVSLGAITGSLAAAVEPRLTHACLVMGGAGLQHILYESAERDAGRFRATWERNGGTRASFAQAIAPYDPATYGDRLSRRTVLMLSAAQDRTIPTRCTQMLWEAAGRPPIVRYPAGHYTIVRHAPAVFRESIDFFRCWE